MPKRFSGLSAAQSSVFEQIAINRDGGHHLATLKSIKRRGMIESYDDIYRQQPGSFELRIKRYFVPIAWHIRWCEWCAEQPDTDDTVAPPASTDTSGMAGREGVG